MDELNQNTEEQIKQPVNETVTAKPAQVNTSEIKTPEAAITTEPVKAVEKTMSAKIQEALHEGYPEAELKGYLMRSNKMSEEDADMAIVGSVKDKIKEATAAGYSEDEVKQYLLANKYDEALTNKAISASKVKEGFKFLDYSPVELTEEEKAQDISDLYKNVYQKYSTTGKQLIGVLDTEKAIEARRDINKLNISISEKLKKEGIDSFLDPVTGEVMMRTSNGDVQEVDSSVLNTIYDSKGEIGGAIAGGLGGASIGAAVGGPVGAVIGGIGGSMAGAAAGRGIDLAINAKKLSEDLTSELYLTQMKEAGIFDGVVGVVGGAAIKSAAKGYKGIVKGYQYLTHGNPNGAYKALKENLNITDDQAKEIVSNWENLNKTSAPGDTFAEKAIAVVSQTTQGAETAVKSAAAQNERVATVFKQSINERAKSLTAAVDTVADANTGSFIRNDLKAYQDDVKGFYDAIKKQGADSINGTDFRFDLDKLAVEPVMNNISKKLSNPIAKEQFVNYATRIEAASKDRTFGGLLELRSAINEFKYSKSLNKPDVDALNNVLNKVDGQIGKAVKEYMPDSYKQWNENFALAKQEYAKMKVLQDNTLFKLVTKKGATEDSIQKALSKYGNDKNVDSEIFNSLVERLAPATKAKVEGAAIKNLVNKNTFGDASELQAVHFPQLAEELKGLNISTPEAKNLVKVVDEISKVFKNDVALAGINGKTQPAKIQTALSSNLVSKAHFAVVSEVWNGIMKYMPTKGAHNLALVSQVGRLLKNPLHAKTAEDLIKSMPVPQQAQMRSLIKELQIQTAKQGPAPKQDFINMYKRSASGKVTASDGAWGKGVYLVDKVKNAKPETNIVKQEVNLSRLATLEDISSLVGKPVTEKDIRKIPNLAKQLQDKNFLGIKINDKAMLFPESTIVNPKQSKGK